MSGPSVTSPFTLPAKRILVTDSSNAYCPTRVAFDHGDVLPVNRYVPIDATTPNPATYTSANSLTPITPPLPNQVWTPTQITAEFTLWRNNGTGRNVRYFILRPGDPTFFWTESAWIIPDGYQINFVSVVADYQPSYRGGARALSDLAPCILSTGPGHSQLRVLLLHYNASTAAYTVEAFTLNYAFNPNYLSPPLGVQPTEFLGTNVTVPLFTANKPYGGAPGLHILANPLTINGKVYRNILVTAGVQLTTGGAWLNYTFTPSIFTADFSSGLNGVPVTQVQASGYNIAKTTPIDFEIIPVGETPYASTVIFLLTSGSQTNNDGYHISMGVVFTYQSNACPTITLGGGPMGTTKNTGLWMASPNSRTPNDWWPVLNYINGSFPQLNVVAQRNIISPEILSAVHVEGCSSQRPSSRRSTYNIFNFAIDAQTNVTGRVSVLNAWANTVTSAPNTQFLNLTRCQCYGIGPAGATNLLYYRFYFDVTTRALIFDVTGLPGAAPTIVQTINRPDLDVATAVHLSTWTDTITYVQPNGSFAFGTVQYSDLGSIVPVDRPSLMEANFNQSTPIPSGPNPDYSPTLSVGEIYRNTPPPLYDSVEFLDAATYWTFRQVAPNFLFGFVCQPPDPTTRDAGIILIELNPTTTNSSESNIIIHDFRSIQLVGTQPTNRLVSFNAPVNIRDDLVQSDSYETVWGVNEADGTTWAVKVERSATNLWSLRWANCEKLIIPLTTLPFDENGHGFTFTCIPMPKTIANRKQTCFLSAYSNASPGGDRIVAYSVSAFDGLLLNSQQINIECYAVANPRAAMSGNYEQFFVQTNQKVNNYTAAYQGWLPEGMLFRFNYSQYTSSSPTTSLYGFTVFNIRRDPSQFNGTETVRSFRAQLCVFSQNFTTTSAILSASDRVAKPSTLAVAKYPTTLNFELTASTNFCEAVPQLGDLTHIPQQQMIVKLNFNFPFNIVPRAIAPLACATDNKNCLAICPINRTPLIGGRPRLFTTDGAGFYTLDPENFFTDQFVSHRAINCFNPTTFMYPFFFDDANVINRVFGFWRFVWQTYSRVAW